MFHRWLTILIALSLVANVSARPRRPPPAMKSRITRDFVDVELGELLRFLGKEMGRNLYLGPGIERRLTVSLRSVPPVGALHEVLASYCPDLAYKLVGTDTLVVVGPDCRLVARPGSMPQRSKDAIRQEILLERAPAAKVIGALQTRYKEVEFIPHPIQNGFYAIGGRREVLEIKNSISDLDVTPEPVESTPVREFVPVRFGDLEEVRSLLATLVPDVTMNVDQRQSILILEGTPAAIGQAKELLEQLDQPLDQVVLECKLVRISEAARHILQMEWEPVPWLGHISQNGQPAQDCATLRLGKFTRNQPGVRALLPLRTNQATTLSSPRVALCSGQAGLIHTGDKFPILRYEPNPGEFRWTYQDVGLRLNPIVTVERGGNIHCRLHGEFTNLKEVLANGLALERTLTFDGELSLRDGETAVLDGLLPAQEALESVTAVPMLAEMPVLGHLFRDIDGDGNVYLMLTPNLMK
jgi:type II secretory pathway component GspD/PulD (secretin)